MKLMLACLAVMAGSLPVAAAASAAPPTPPLPDCANPIAPDQLSVDQDAVGYTVRRGQTVEAFDVKILGVLKDGIAPGRDLIVIDTSGPVIDEGGISEGMSGSPVYTLDGELIGAVSYSFTYGKSPIGGVTPAPDMLDVLNAPYPSARSAGHDAALDAGTRARIAAAENVPSSSVPNQLAPIPSPISISGAGMFPAHRDLLTRAFKSQGLNAAFTGAATRSSPIFPSANLQAGDSFGAAFSFGDVGFGAIGETTYVCNNRLVAFGHPFLLDGPTRMGATRADILRIVDDPVGPSFKLGQLTDPVGILDQDRLAAVGARIGEPIPTFPLTQTTTDLDSGNTREGDTQIVDPLEGSQLTSYTPDIVLTHYFLDSDTTIDRIGQGSARVSFTITADDPESGDPLSVTRVNRFTSRFDIVSEASDDLINAVFTLAGRSVPIEPTGVSIDVSAERAVREFKIKRVLWGAGNGPLRSVKNLTVRPGKRVRAQAILISSNGDPNTTANFVFRVPRKAHFGQISLVGGSEFGSDFSGEDAFFCRLFGDCSSGGAEQGAQDALDAIEEAPRNDQIIAQIAFDNRRDEKGRIAVTDAHKRKVGKVVTGDDSVRIRVAR